MVLMGIAASAAAAWCMRKISKERYGRFLTFLSIAMLVSEVWKQWYLTFVLNGGHYNVWYFPFQLCSLPMYLYLFYEKMPEQWQKRIDIFIMDFSLMGGVAVFLDPSGMQYSRWMLTVHSYLWHYLLIFLGCLSGFRWMEMGTGGFLRDSLREFVNALPIFCAGALLATVLNLTLWRFGEISMFYLSPFETSNQIIFRDIARNAGILVGNISYFLAMVAAAFIFHGFWCGLRWFRSNP